jgi:hypothetical protein
MRIRIQEWVEGGSGFRGWFERGSGFRSGLNADPDPKSLKKSPGLMFEFFFIQRGGERSGPD